MCENIDETEPIFIGGCDFADGEDRSAVTTFARGATPKHWIIDHPRPMPIGCVEKMRKLSHPVPETFKNTIESFLMQPSNITIKETMKIETFKKKIIPAILAMSELEFAIYRSVKMLGRFSKKEYLMDMAHQMPNLKSDKAWRALENLGVKRTKGLYSLKMV